MTIRDDRSIFAFADNVRAMRGVYEPDTDSHAAKREDFKTLDPAIKEDDLVVVTTDNRHGFTVVKVTDADVTPDLDSNEPCRWIINKLSLEGFEQIQRQDAILADQIRESQLRKRRREIQKDLLDDEARLEIEGKPLYGTALRVGNGDVAAAPPPEPPVGDDEPL